MNEKVLEAWREATKRTGLNLQIVTAAAIAQAPINLEERLETFDEVSFVRLSVKNPDAYDLTLMKICRNADVDREDILHLHKKRD